MPNQSLRVLLLGATGTIGRATAAALIAAGHEVVAVVRPGAMGPAGCARLEADVTQAGDLAAAIGTARFDAVISCLASRTGAPKDAWAIDHRANSLALAAAIAADIPRFVLLSAICVQKPLLEFQRAKLAFEAELKAEAYARWDIARFDADVRASQARRWVVYEALRNGAYFPWDFQPLQKASEQYMRNHMDLNILEDSKRFPRGE